MNEKTLTCITLLGIALLSMIAIIEISEATKWSANDEVRFHRFLVADQTNEAKYDKDNHNCLDFSMDLISNATDKKFDLLMVNIEPCDMFIDGHYAVAYQKEDGKWIMIEPQTDEVMNKKLEQDGTNETILIFTVEGTERITHGLTVPNRNIKNNVVA